jgi:hypothetical protein
MRRSVTLLLLAVAACGRVSAPTNSADLPAPSNMTGRSGAPAPSAPMPMDLNMSAGAAPDDAQTGGPRERFIVCPGNPRCPPSGNPPRNKPD